MSCIRGVTIRTVVQPKDEQKEANKEMKEKEKQEVEEEQARPAKKRTKRKEKQELEEEQVRPAKKRAKGKEKQEEGNEGKKKRRRISATMEQAFSMMEEYGVYEEDVYPYKAVKDESFVTPASAVACGRKFFIFGSIIAKHENLSTVEAKVIEALEHHPVVGTMESHRSLRKFKGKVC